MAVYEVGKPLAKPVDSDLSLQQKVKKADVEAGRSGPAPKKRKLDRLLDKLTASVDDVQHVFRSAAEGHASLKKRSKRTTDVIDDIRSFSALIDDRVTDFRKLSARIDSDDNKMRVVCSQQPEGDLAMMPAYGFFSSLTRYVNSTKTDRTAGTDGLTGSFMRSMNRPGRRTELLVDLVNFFFTDLAERREKSKKKISKKLFVRTLRPDPAGRWPSQRSCRAILHHGYRSDLSHQFAIEAIAQIVPDGMVFRYQFDGDLLTGAVVVPDYLRVDNDVLYGGGLMFFSGEIGNRRMGLRPFLYSSSLDDISIVGQEHAVGHSSSLSHAEVLRKMRDAVQRELPLVTTAIDRMVKAQSVIFLDDGSDFVPERLIIALRNDISADVTLTEIKVWLRALLQLRSLTKGPLTALMLQNSLAAVANTLDDPIRQIRISAAAGHLLDVDWDAVTKRAATIDLEKVESVFNGRRK